MVQFRMVSAAAVAGVLALAACSSSGGSHQSDSSPSKSASPSPTFTGPDIKIGTIGNLTKASAFGNAEPDQVSAIQAAIDATNAAGGINGSKLVLDACDEMNDPNVAATCARRLVSDGVVATVGENTLDGAKIGPILQQAGIPRIGPAPLSIAEYTAPNAYPLNGGGVTLFQGAVIDAKQHNLKSIYVLYLNVEGGGSAVTGLVKPLSAKEGIAYKGDTGVPTDATDVSSYVKKAMDSGAEAVLTTFGPGLTEQFLKTSTQLGAKYRVATTAESFTGDVIKAVGPTQPIVQNAMLASPYPPLTATSVQGVKDFAAQMNARKAAGDKNASADRTYLVNPWLATHVFAEVAKTISGPVTAKSVMDAMNAAKDVNTDGLTPPWTPSQSGGILPRVSNGAGWFSKVATNGDQVLESTEPVQILSTEGVSNILK
jgi:ABC-type branched-subunit amino acid transport system substrate-binding protein